MTEQDLATAIKALGWSPKRRQIGSKVYWYAKRRVGLKVIERYLFPYAEMKEKTQADVWEKLLT